MKKVNYLKMFFLLWGLMVGIGNVSAANDYDYEWVETSFSDLQTGDVVVLVDEHLGNIALPNYDSNFEGVPVDVQGTKLSGTVSDNIQWKIRKNDDGTVTFLDGNSPLLVTSGGELKVGGNGIYNFTYNDGKLSCTVNNTTYYLFWWLAGSAGGDKYWARPTENNNDPNLARFTFYKKVPKNYVKWKRVDGLNGTSQNLKVPLKNNDIVVVVDLKTGKAMSNDKGEKDPAGVAVTLNYDKDRIIMDEVPENVQWRYQYNSGNTLVTIDETPQQLYTDADKGLKVGNITEATNPISTFVFTTKNGAFFPVFEIEGTDYQPNFDDGMFSNSWTLEKVADYDGDGIAIFKKVEDPQKVVKIEMDENCLVNNVIHDAYLNASITGAEFDEIKWNSSKPGVATAETVTRLYEDRKDGQVTGYNRGSTVITAYVIETDYHDKASAKCEVIMDDMRSETPGTILNPFTVAQAKELAEKGTVKVSGTTINLEEGVKYYIKGKVSKVNSGMMAMFGDMDFGEMMGGSGSSSFNFEDSMDDMDFDPEDMEESGFDMSSFDMSSFGFDMSAMFGTSDKVTYYISDDGTKDAQMKVVNGCGKLTNPGTGAMEFETIPKLSPGDCVVVCGPLVYTEDTNMFSSMMGGNNSEEPKMSGKVDELNYLAVYDPTLLIKDDNDGEVDNKIEIYVNETLDGKTVYEIDELFDYFNNEIKIPSNATIEKATFKSSDEDIAKCEESEDKNTTIITGVSEGKAKITVKVKVLLQKADDQANPKVEEKSYTMKRKFKLIVKTRDVEPAGKYAGDYVLTTDTKDLEEGTRLILVGTRVKEDKETAEKTYTDYVMVENNAMMGGGKNGSKIDEDKFEKNKTKIPCENAPKGTLEVVLEPAEGDSWYLNVGKDENGNKLYLYASDKQDEGSGNNNSNPMMEMFMSNSGLKVATMDAATADSCKATITINTDGATIQYPKTEGKKTIIKLDSSFDMEEMMKMFSSTGEGEGQGEGQGSSSSFDMGSFDMFMAAFNTKKTDDEKGFMPRIYRFVPDPSFDITVDGSGWSTIVTYNDVTLPETLEAYAVTEVQKTGDEKTALISNVDALKGGEPYLLYGEGGGKFTLTLSENEVAAPDQNILEVSDANTTDGVYVLAKPEGQEAAFYKWGGGLLGSGRVYLPAEAGANSARILFAFDDISLDGIATGINEANVKKQMTKGKAYDLQGRRVSVTNGQIQKGLYIINGKKVVIK